MPLPCIDPARYEDQLAAKLARYRADFAEFSLPEPRVFRSAPLHYRLRAEFRLWHHDGRIDYAMFDSADPKQPILVDNFPPAAEPIAALMPRLRDALQASEPLRRAGRVMRLTRSPRKRKCTSHTPPAASGL